MPNQAKRSIKSTYSKVRDPMLCLALLCLATACSGEGYRPASKLTPPPVMREFRAAWIPTVGNSCWPSQPGLPTATQKAELIALLDCAVELKLNAVIFQVRPACDALYKSDIEPWSEYLTGRQGQAPSPYYDPLEFAVAEAHKRGLELHAWFNPYRARHQNATSAVAANHVSKTHPALTRTYGNYLWLDPGERDVQDYSLRVVLDVVKRYDIDAVHFDDYFYPYPGKNRSGATIEFPDAVSWKKYGLQSGLSRDDWRRKNVDDFIQRVNRAVHAEKPWVKFGLSPFGIWRPKHPPTIQGMDAYDALHADARKWLREGWCDYMAPQLYWAIDPPAQSFPVLLQWWQDQNVKRRHLWPGVNSLKVGFGWKADEIVNQIEITRKRTNPPGVIHWSESALMKCDSLRAALKRETYREPALVPAFPWLDKSPPAKPRVTITISGAKTTVAWKKSNAEAEQPAWWVVQSLQYSDWKTRILPGNATSITFALKPAALAVTAVDRSGNTSQPGVMELR